MTARLTRPQVEALMFDSDPWLSCDECFDRADFYVECIARGLEPDDPAMDVHLTCCPACREEAATLLALLTGSAR